MNFTKDINGISNINILTVDTCLIMFKLGGLAQLRIHPLPQDIPRLKTQDQQT